MKPGPLLAAAAAVLLAEGLIGVYGASISSAEAVWQGRSWKAWRAWRSALRADADLEGWSDQEDVDGSKEALLAERDDLRAQLATKNKEFLDQHRRADHLAHQVHMLESRLRAEKQKEAVDEEQLSHARAALAHLGHEATDLAAAMPSTAGTTDAGGALPSPEPAAAVMHTTGTGAGTAVAASAPSVAAASPTPPVVSPMSHQTVTQQTPAGESEVAAAAGVAPPTKAAASAARVAAALGAGSGTVGKPAAPAGLFADIEAQLQEEDSRIDSFDAADTGEVAATQLQQRREQQQHEQQDKRLLLQYGKNPLL